MATSTLASLSNDLAELTTAGAESVVQVGAGRRPASGIVHGADTIITTARAIGREDGLQVRLPDDTTVDADLVGWDPSSGVALLRTRVPDRPDASPAAPGAKRAPASSRSRSPGRGATPSPPAPASSRSSADRCAPDAGASWSR